MFGEDSHVAQLPAGPLQDKATSACASCHEGRIIVQQRLSKAAWTKEMDKMIKWGAAVDAADRDGLIDYFTANFGPDQAAYEATRTTAKTPTKRNPKAKH
jgi:hypothetical protein